MVEFGFVFDRWANLVAKTAYFSCFAGGFSGITLIASVLRSPWLLALDDFICITLIQQDLIERRFLRKGLKLALFGFVFGRFRDRFVDSIALIGFVLLIFIPRGGPLRLLIDHRRPLPTIGERSHRQGEIW